MPRAHKASVEGKKRKRDERRSESVQDGKTRGEENDRGVRERITDEEKEREREGEKRAYGPHLPIARGW